MKEESQALATAFNSSGETSYQKTYTLKKSEDRIVILALRVGKGREVEIREALKSMTEFVAGPIGTPCPCCNGTGRM